MAVKFFGQYLVEKGIINRETLLKAVELQESVNLRFGEMALSMGLITEADVDRVHKAQWAEDLPFGEMAVKLGMLTRDQMDQVLTKQRNSHLYIGEALFKVGGLDQDELKRYLEEFKADQAPYQTSSVTIPAGVPHPILWEIAADLTYKMLTRIAGLSFRPDSCRLANQVPANHLVAMIRLDGNVKARYILSVSQAAVLKITEGILNHEKPEGELEEILADAAKEFVNVVCGNFAAKAAQIGKCIEIHPPEICQGGAPLRPGEIALLFPIHVANGESVQLTIVVDKG